MKQSNRVVLFCNGQVATPYQACVCDIDPDIGANSIKKSMYVALVKRYYPVWRHYYDLNKKQR